MNDCFIPLPSFSSPSLSGFGAAKATPAGLDDESDLLKSIRRALNATTPAIDDSPHRTLSASREGEEELFWQGRAVVWSVGGVQKRRWVFDTEGKDQVLWACWASFDSENFSPIYGPKPTKPSAVSSFQRHVYNAAPTQDEDSLATFGHLSKLRPPTTLESAYLWSRFNAKGPKSLTRCLCIFLTSFAMIYTKDGGAEYVANMPFHVRRAWDIPTGGVMLERVIAADEVDGDLLPTLFTLSGPYEEVNIVGFTHPNYKGADVSVQPVAAPSVFDRAIPEEEPPATSRKTWSKRERLIYCSSDPLRASNVFIVSHDPTSQKVRVWRCVTEEPSRLPSAPPKKPEDKDNMYEAEQTPDDEKLDPVMVQLPAGISSYPSISTIASQKPAPNSTQDSIAASLALAHKTAGGPPVAKLQDELSQILRKGAPHARNESNSRNELSITLDRMAIGGSGEEARDLGLGNRLIDDTKMEPEFWLECLSDALSVSPGDTAEGITVCTFDSSLHGIQLAIHIPSTSTIHLLMIGLKNDKVVCELLPSSIPAISVAQVMAIRPLGNDLLIIRPDQKLAVVTYGLLEIDVYLTGSDTDVEMSDIIDAMPLKVPSTLQNLHDPTKPAGPSKLRVDKRPARLKDPVHAAVTVVFRDGTEARAALGMPLSKTVASCMLALSGVLPAHITFDIRRRQLRRWVQSRKPATGLEHFTCFSEAVMESLCRDGVGDHSGAHRGQPTRMASFNILPDAWSQLECSISHSALCMDSAIRHLQGPRLMNQLPKALAIDRVLLPTRITRPPSWASPAMQALHILAESRKLVSGTEIELRWLAGLLIRMGRLVAADWSDHWAMLVPEEPDAWMPVSSYAFTRDPLLPTNPPDILKSLSSCLHHQSESDFTSWSFSTLAHRYGFKPFLEYYPISVASISSRVLDLYPTLMDTKARPDPIARAQEVVSSMARSGFTSHHLAGLPLGVSLPLKEAIRLCQENPPMDWSPALYKLIDRMDLAKMASDWTTHYPGYGESFKYKRELQQRDGGETVGSIVQNAKMIADGILVDKSGQAMYNREFSDVRFGVDRRLREVDRMLQTSSTTTVKILERPDLNEHDLAKEQHSFAVIVAERTLSLPVGRALYTYGSLETVDSDSYTMPKIDLSVRMVPQNVTVAVDSHKIVLESRLWGDFHHGAASGLRIARRATGIDSTWIAFNRPNDLTAEHAGFLLGLGINGHLRGMYTWHTFSYLTPKHEMTTIAMLLGLASSYVGTGELFITKMLTVHTPALLPHGAAEMNLGLWTQMAGLMGVGILYLGRKDRRMAEACLTEIGGRDFGTRLEVTNESKEAYAITAALAFGLIMCGHGNTSKSPADLEMVSKLRSLVHGEQNVVDDKPIQAIFGVALTSPAASIALGLMFMKTERADIARLFEISYKPSSLARLQPSLMFVWTLSKLLIQWDQINPTVAWVTSQIPEKTSENAEVQRCDQAMKDSYDLAYYNITAGVCFAIALKFSGTGDQRAETTLLHFYDALSKTAIHASHTFDSLIKRSAVRDGLNLLSVCVGIVMAGTGELNALRRLRYAHGQLLPFVKYGSHMTSHIALGMLFLGGGRYTLGTSNAAIACLICAFYPRWPNHSSDSKGFLPIFRHLWALAVEPRCLTTRDADTGETVYMPVKLQLKEGKMLRTYQYTSPSLIPELMKLVSITVDSPRYWPYHIEVMKSPPSRFAMNVMRSQTIWVKRRSGYLGYGEDPRGNKSIFAFFGSRVGDSSTMDSPTGTAEERLSIKSELEQFLTSFSVDSRIIGFADWLCRNDPQSQLDAVGMSYCQQSLLESVLRNKTSTAPSLMDVFRAKHGTSFDRMLGNGMPTLALQDFRLALNFYSYSFRTSNGSKATERERESDKSTTKVPLIRVSLLQAAVDVFDAYVRDLRDNEPDFMDTLKGYLRGEGLGQDMDPAVRVEMGKKLAIYLAYEQVPGVEVIGAVRRASAKMMAGWEANPNAAGDIKTQSPQTLRKDVHMILRSTLMSQNGFPTGGMSWRAFDDMMSSGCF
ncbi:Anaphase-promoting complex subunit 1 [Tulasnella sp. JGI-2019a]|nr:Anaphase-promoting complex subunit 1 [Tulasnella sp. JGI-2019a]